MSTIRPPKAMAKKATTDPKTIVWELAWLSLPVTFGVLEGRAMATHETDDTLSATMRKVWHTDTKLGRTVWLLSIGIFGALLAGHIMGTNETEWS